MGYDAFISYSHAGDARVAAAVEQGLERLARPWYRLHAISVFHDQSDLALTPHLWSTIETTLDDSRFFVVLASPESSASTWVNREVAHWCDSRGTEELLLVITGGEIEWDDSQGGFTPTSTAVPDALRHRFTEEPLWVDLRWARGTDELSLHISRFRDAIAQLASRIHGIPKDELEGEDARLHRRARRLARSAVATLVVLTLVAAGAAVAAIRNAHRADQRTREAVAREVGLEALDEPASALDRALLLSLAAGGLDTGSGADRYRSSRTLIGRYARLERILETGTKEAVTSVRGLAFGPDGSSLAASVLSSDRDNRATTAAVRWSPIEGADRPIRRATAAPTGPVSYTGATATLAIGGVGDAPTVVPAVGPAQTATGQVVVASRPDLDRAVVAAGGRDELVVLSSGALLASEPASGTRAVIAADAAALRRGSTVVLRAVSDGHELASGPLAAVDVGQDAVSVLAVGPTATVVVDLTSGPNGLRLQRWERHGHVLAPASTVPVLRSTAIDGQLLGAALSPDGSHVLVMTTSGSAMLDAHTGATLAEDSGAPGTTAGDPTGRYVAMGGPGLAVWDLQIGQRVLAVPDPVNVLAWARSTPRLVTVGRSLDVWDVATPRHVRLAEDTNAQTVAIAADGATIASAGWGASVSVWQMDPTADDVGRETLAAPASGAAGSASAYDADSRTLARLEAGDVRVELPGRPARSTALVGLDPDRSGQLRLLADGTRALVAPTSGGGPALWDVGTGQQVALDAVCRHDLIAASGDGALVASFDSSDRVLAVCDARTGRLQTASRISATMLPVTALAVADDGAVAVGGGQGLVARFPRAGGRFGAGTALDVRLGGQAVTVSSVAVGAAKVVAGLSVPAGDTSSAAAGTGRVLVWDRSGSEPVVFDVDQRRVPAVGLFGPDDAVLVFATQDDEGGAVQLQVAESATRRELGRPLSGLSGAVTELAADSTRANGDVTAVVGVDADGRAFRWPIDRDPSREICAIVGRPLTRSEWDAAAARQLSGGDFSPQCGR